jgi:hypothetical protein
MTHLRILSTLLFMSFLVLPAFGQVESKQTYDRDKDPLYMKVDDLKADIQNRHPGDYYILASRLFEEGKKDEAVFWFYTGQLRARYFISGSDREDVKEDFVYLDAIFQTWGPTFNGYAFGDLPKLRETIDKVIQWDEETPNGFFSKSDHAEARERVVKGLLELRQDTIDREDEIRSKRKEAGLENR